jgi:1-acyl-sn-glycerol-3-phosphate acyltransferase
LLPAGPSILCFSHQNWIDPFFLISAFPARPRTHFFGPEQEDMTRGFRNRLMRWAGVAVPYRPGRRGLVAATRRVEELLAAGDCLAIAGEGRIHAGEGVVLPLLDGPAHLALRSGVPLVPVAINGTSWLAFRRRVRVRIGQPIEPVAGGSRRPTAADIEELTAEARAVLLGLVADFPDPPRSRWIGGRLTELFNDWPEGARPPVPPRTAAGADT